uniref:Maestro/Maestro-like HEAT-repeats domain-containing protein n=1 Tax=Eutreptiella gymnastica TaxID=73025 RepID=A0A7S1HY31_9EUGL
MPHILVHINDDEVLVRQASKYALHAVCKWLILRNPKTALRSLMERPSYQPDKKMQYDEFCREFGAVWVREYFSYVNDMLMALHGLFKVYETRESIKANAAILSGNIVSHLDPEGWRRCNVEQTTSGLIALMSKDESALVRSKAAKSLGLYT